MTPRLLVQNPGGVCSTPQGTDLKFLVISACLLTWMASASYKIEHKGSTMYNTPSILAQLGECDVRMSTSCQEHVFSIQPANSPDTKACDSLPLVLSTHLQTWVLTKVEYFPWFGPFAISWAHPGMRKNCEVSHTGGRCVAPVAICFQRCNLIQTEKCSRA